MHFIKKYYQLNSLTKWLVISCIVFALGDALTTAACLTIESNIGYEANPIWNFVYKHLGLWIGSVLLLTSKYFVLVLTCFGALRARDKNRKIFEWLFVLFYLGTHVACVINNTQAFVFLLLYT